MKKLSGSIIFFITMIAFTMQNCTNNANAPAPSEEYFVSVVKELSSPEYYGRSNYMDGAVKAGKFIISEMESIGVGPIPQSVIDKAWEGKVRPELHPLQPEFKSLISPSDPGRWSDAPEEHLSYLQHFSHPLNAQRGAVELVVDGKRLVNTVDYTLKEFSPTYKGELDVVYLDNKFLDPESFCKHMDSGKYRNKAVVLDWDKFKETMYTYPGIEVYKTYFVPLKNVGAIICKGEELLPYFKSRNHFNTPMPVFMVDANFPDNARKVSINVEGEMVHNDAHNIIAYIPGSKHPDKHFILACHYDHLGVCGEDIFYGANDNSSGSAMLLNLMRYFRKNQPEYSIVFIFFDSEENNLLGSFFYADNPLLPLDDIQFFLELDMIGDNGNTVVCQSSDAGIEGLEYLKKVNSGMENPFGKFQQDPFEDYADHYPFGLKGVPAMYMELNGDTNKNYHSPRDNFENFYSSNYNRVFTLVTGFIEGFKR